MTLDAIVSDACSRNQKKGNSLTTSSIKERFSRPRSISIRLASTPSELEAIYKFRYQIYVEEMELPQSHADHKFHKIEDPLDHGAYNIGAFQGDKVVGAVRLNFPRTSRIGYYETFLDMWSAGRFHPHATSICTRLMVAARLRGSALAVRLSQATYELALHNQIRFNFVDCNDRLIAFFTGLGYTIHRRAAHPEYGIGNVMRLDLLDRMHLAQTRSPFRAILDQSSASFAVP